MKKKYLIFFLMLIFISNDVKAEEQIYKDITEDVEVRYKWYKEIISEEGEYYPLRKITPNDKYDKNNIKYVSSSRVNEAFCSYSEEFYKLEKKEYRIYKKLYDAEYVVIENIAPQTNIQIYYKNIMLNYKIVSQDDNKLVLYLNMPRLCDRLLFYVDNSNNYKISLYKDSELQQIIISKEFENQKISIPDYTWTINESSYYETSISLAQYEESSLTTLIQEKTMCGYSEKYVYKYNVEKEYYDDYHTYVEGYIKDIDDYRYYYKDEPIIINNTIEVIKEKIKEVPKIEYVYLEKEVTKEENHNGCLKEIQTKIETKIIEKEISKIPGKIYILISILFMIIIIFVIKEIVKKCKLN